ncbi:hypothetical protein GQX73_g6413 [Xylaria multiplex]|uniref:MIT domain-containing protein n=1 Tax=Xylaria multiplex TaxID=323545 RepID=A0A7C8IM49_9PEZI|nr:hypothetical protein GQX73_g6413 [Xylaria multiplex]
MTTTRMPLSSKATLSAALAKARTAVQLDQAQYHDGAKAYYVEVVEMLARVITRASDEKDIKKLKDIRRAYTNRIQELNELLAYS